MADRVYVNISRPNLRLYRGGKVGARKGTKGWTTNNYYHSLDATATGDRLKASDPLIGYAAPTSHDYNRIYEKIRDAVNGDKGETLTTVVEWRTSLDMITSRADQLRKLYLDLRRGNLRGTRKVITTRKGRKKLIKVKRGYRKPDPSDLWLEYWMGWAPLVGDMAHAAAVLSRAPPLNQMFNEGVSFKQHLKREINTPMALSYQRDDRQAKGRLAFYGQYKITNHNLHLAQAYGVVNPVLTAFQVTPLSFLVNWIANIDQFLGALTDFVGVDFIQTGYGIKQTVTGSRLGHFTDKHQKPWRKVYFSESGASCIKFRLPGALVPPTLAVQLPKLNLTRAATSTALLLKVLQSQR